MQALIWGLKCLLSMLRCMLGSVKGVKSENPNLLNKKEGNITRVNSSQNLASQAGRQAGAHLPPREGSSLAAPQAARQAGTHLPQGEGSNLLASQSVHSQAGTHLPSREGSNLVASQANQAGRQATSQAHLPPGEGSSLAQAGTCLPLGEGSILVASQAIQSGSFPSQCSPSPWGRKQFSGTSSFPGRHSPSLRERKQLINNSDSSPLPW